jgi:hypothetical protein
MKTPKCILAFENIGISKCFTILKKGLKHETLSKLGHFLTIEYVLKSRYIKWDQIPMNLEIQNTIYD